MSKNTPDRTNTNAPAQTGQDATGDVAAFLKKVRATPSSPRPSGGRGRLIFAMDATASREPSWDMACQIQGEMFNATKTHGGLDVQLVFYRGFGECKASSWAGDATALARLMTSVRCRAGKTQINRILKHAIGEQAKNSVGALVFVGDCFEEEIDHVCHTAGELGLLNVPVFMFHEGHDPIAARAFREIARLTGGAYCPFDASSASQLKELLSAVAVYASGGRAALADYSAQKGGEVLRLTQQIRSR